MLDEDPPLIGRAIEEKQLVLKIGGKIPVL